MYSSLAGMSMPYTFGWITGGAQLAKKTLFAPADLAISTILFEVFPLTMLSSTIRTFLFLNSPSIVFNFFLTESFLTLWPGMMNVLPIYRFLTKPSRYCTPRVLAISNAAILPLSGTGTTTSISWDGLSASILSPSNLPILSLAPWTEIPSMVESGLEK